MSRREQGAHNDPDDAIRLTDDDAAASRLSAITLGYLEDPYTALLYRSTSGIGSGGSSRKAPLINVGTHHRTVAIDQLVDRFLDEAGPNAQIVSLGAGSDSRFWRLHSRGKKFGRYVEIDFPNLTSLKAQRIARSPKLSSPLSLNDQSSSSSIPPQNDLTRSSGQMLPPSTPLKRFKVEKGGTQLISDTYILLPLDLRLNPSQSLQSELLPHLDASTPTLFLAECVFCYMQPKQSEEILSWFGRTFSRVVGVVYEMCGLTDTFGQVMRRNLAARNLSIPGAEPFLDVASQAARFKNEALGDGIFEESGAKSLWQIREEVIPQTELSRISKLEFLDEIEELRLVLNHYCVAWGSKGMTNIYL